MAKENMNTVKENNQYTPLTHKYPFLKGNVRKIGIGAFCLWKYHRIYYRGYKRSNRNLKTKFLLVCIPRSGSSLLGSYINSHPDIHWDDERFHVNFLAPTRLVNGLAHRSDWPHYGAKLFLHQIDPVEDLSLISSLITEMPVAGWKFVSLIRENVLRHALSFEKFRKGGASYSLDGQHAIKPHAKISLDMRDFMGLLSWIEGYKNFQRTIFSAVTHFPIIYEDHLMAGDQHGALLNDLFEFLDVPPYRVSTPHVKQSSVHFEDEIINYEEFLDTISSTPYVRYL